MTFHRWQRQNKGNR